MVLVTNTTPVHIITNKERLYTIVQKASPEHLSLKGKRMKSVGFNTVVLQTHNALRKPQFSETFPTCQ